MCRWLSLPLVLLVGACQASVRNSDGIEPQLVVTVLDDSLGDLRADFNRNRDCLRLIAFLSPTFKSSELGAQVVRDAVLARFGDASLRVSIVWVEMLPGDDAEAVERESGRFTDARVRNFHDEERRAGRAFAEGLLPSDFARDVYLFYEPGVLWIDRPPMPTIWSHQMGNFQTEYYHPGDLLATRLAEGAGALLARHQR